MQRPLEITSLTKAFGEFVAVKEFSARIQPGEFVSLLGHSGCGKSTVLSIVAGLSRATFGGIVIDGREVTEPGLERAVVFQSPCLLPWMSALDNVVLAARQRHGDRAIEVARKYMEMVGIAEFAAQLPAELSQGTQQRVAIARALSLEPRFLLLDEPFGMLDSLTRGELEDLVLALWEKERKTVIMVTHDVDEAVYMSDRIILMTDGPEARLGLDLPIDLPRPRDRHALAGHPRYSALRQRIIDYLEKHTKQFAHHEEAAA